MLAKMAVLALAAVLPVTAAAQDNRTHMKRTFPACKSWDDFKALTRLISEKDEAAYVAFMLREPGCKILNQGQTVTVQGVGVLSNTRCVRPAGDPDCYWTVGEAVEELRAPSAGPRDSVGNPIMTGREHDDATRLLNEKYRSGN
jgi:hypothetical protein